MSVERSQSNNRLSPLSTDGKVSASDSLRDLEQLTALLKLLADPTRLAILMRLTSGECNVSTLCAELSLPQPTVSHHLGLLRMSNIISNRRDGKQVFYSLGGRVEPVKIGALHIAADGHTIQIFPRIRA